MDHFNITILDGAMVSTRRGFQVSKHKHNGISFINTSADEPVPRPSSSGSTLLPVSREITFVGNGDGRKSKKKGRTRRENFSDAASQSLKLRKPRHSADYRRSPCSGLSSSSPSTAVSDDFSVEEASTEETPNDHVLADERALNTKILPTWASYKSMQNEPDPEMRLKFMALAFASNQPGQVQSKRDVNLPQREDKDEELERSAWLVQDPTSVHCALTLGALFDAIKLGKLETPRLNALASQLYSIVNRRVSENNLGKKAREVTVRAIASLAIIAGYQGKCDHWYVHMKGLLRLVDLSGGKDHLDSSTLDIIRKANLVGAISAATKPFLTPESPYVSNIHPAPTTSNGEPACDIRCYLEAFQLNPATVKAVIAVAGMSKYLNQGRNESDYTSTEEHLRDFYQLACTLLSYPQPLRNFDEIISPCTSVRLSLHAQNYSTTETINNTASNTLSNAVEIALRILCLMYVKELSLDIPCGTKILLDLLKQQVAIISSDRKTNEFEDLFTEPMLQAELRMLQRPVLIWICLAGEFFATMKCGSGDRYTILKNSPYRGLLRDLVVEEPPASASLSDEELKFCTFLDMSHVVGTPWDCKEAMRDMLGTIKTE